MKFLRTFGVAALAVAAMAIVGTGTASAAKLCASGSENSGCGAGKGEYSGWIHLDTPAFRASTFTTNVTTVHCDSEITIFANSSTGTPITGEVSNLSFYSCQTSGGTACTVTTKNLPYNLSLETTSLKMNDLFGVGALVKCGFLINCELTTSEAKFSVNGSWPVKITGSGIKMNRSGGFCPETAEWDVVYEPWAPFSLTVV